MKHLIKTYVTFLVTIAVLSCKDKTNCSNADLSDTITVSGFGDVTRTSISFFRLGKQVEEVKINSVKYQNNKNLSGYGEGIVTLEEPLFSEENYRLIIDSNKYDITDIKIKSEVRMKGMREDSICWVDAFKINKEMAKQIYNTSTITFHKPN